MGLSKFVEDERFRESRAALWEGRYGFLLQDIWDSAFSLRTLEEVDALVAQCGGDITPLNDYQRLCAHPQVTALQLISEFTHPIAVTCKAIAPPWHLHDNDTSMRHPPPTLGQHTKDVLSEVGVSPNEIKRLRSNGVII